MRKFLATLLVMSATLFVVACSNGGGGGGTQTPVCPSTHVFDAASNTCVPGTNLPGTGVVPNNGIVQFYDYNRQFVQSGWGVQTYTGDMQITNAAAYKSFLKEAMAVCDRNIWGGQWGLADCDSWVGGSFQVSWRMDGSLKPVVSFEAYPATSYYNYTLSFGIDAGGVAFNPLTLSQNNTFSLVNNSKGFEIRANGSYWNGGGLRLIQIIVREGTVAQNTVTYELYYPHNNVSTKFATGKFKRY